MEFPVESLRPSRGFCFMNLPLTASLSSLPKDPNTSTLKINILSQSKLFTMNSTLPTSSLYEVIDRNILNLISQPQPAYRQLWITGSFWLQVKYDHLRFKPLQYLDLKEADAKEACGRMMNEMPKKPKIVETSNVIPKYDIHNDVITLPDWYMDWQAQCIICFHELIHATGHPKRLNTEVVCGNVYEWPDLDACMEIIAETGSLYLQASGGIVSKYFLNSIAYMQLWLQKTHNTVSLVEFAMQHAKQACEYVLQGKKISSGSQAS